MVATRAYGSSMVAIPGTPNGVGGGFVSWVEYILNVEFYICALCRQATKQTQNLATTMVERRSTICRMSCFFWFFFCSYVVQSWQFKNRSDQTTSWGWIGYLVVRRAQVAAITITSATAILLLRGYSCVMTQEFPCNVRHRKVSTSATSIGYFASIQCSLLLAKIFAWCDVAVQICPMSSIQSVCTHLTPAGMWSWWARVADRSMRGWTIHVIEHGRLEQNCEMNNIHIDSSLCAPMWLARLKLSLLLSKKDTYAGNPLSLSWGKRPLVLVEMTWFKAGKKSWRGHPWWSCQMRNLD